VAAAAAADAQAMAGNAAAAAETGGDGDDDDSKLTEHLLKNFQSQISNINSHQNQLIEREHVDGHHHCVHLCTLKNQLFSGYSTTDNLSRHRFQFEPHSWSATVIN